MALFYGVGSTEFIGALMAQKSVRAIYYMGLLDSCLFKFTSSDILNFILYFINVCDVAVIF